MLSTLRSLSKSWFVKGLMALLVVSFAIWGIGDMFRGNPAARPVARVGREKITVSQLEFNFQKSLPDARRQFGGELSAAQARQMGLLDQTLSIMVDQSAIHQETARLGLKVGQDVVLSTLASIPQFRDKDGRFTVDLWRQALSRAGITEEFFFQAERRDAARRLLLNALVGGITAPKTVVDNIYRARGAKRLLEIVSLRNDSVRLDAKPDEAALKAFYEANKEAYRAPDYRGMTVARLAVSDIVGEFEISADELRAAYEENASAFLLPERRDLVQVVLQDEAKAQALSRAARERKNLHAAAKATGSTPIVMKKIDDKTVLPELYTTVFGLGEGEISAPVKSGLGWHVVQVSKIYDGGQQPFEEVKEQIRATLAQERSGDILARNVNQLDDQIAGGATLEEIADSLKLRLARVARVDATGKTPDGKEFSDFPLPKEALEAAFAQQAGETSQVLEVGESDYLVVRTDGVEPSHTRPFEEVKDKIAKAWLESKMAEGAAAQANKMADEMRKGKSATSFAALPGVSVRLSRPISLLGDMDNELVPTAVQHVFVMQKGDVIALSGPGRHYVIRLADIVPVDPKKPESSRLKVVDDLKQTIPSDIVFQYLSHVEEIFPVKIDSAFLEELRNRRAESSL